MTSPLEFAAAEIERLDGEMARLKSLRDAWQKIIEGYSLTTPPPQQVAPSDRPVVKMGDEAEGEGVETPNDYGWRINAVRDIFRGNPFKGFTPAEIWKIVQERNISDRQGFVYSTLARLTNKQHQLTRKRGRYYAATSLLGEEPIVITERGDVSMSPASAA
jgi:hypothetical protein